jgi:hypothetical protein
MSILLSSVAPQPETKTASQPGVEQAVNDGVDVYIYGYPLVTMDMTRKFITNYATVKAVVGRFGQIIKLRPPPAKRD